MGGAVRLIRGLALEFGEAPLQKLVLWSELALTEGFPEGTSGIFDGPSRRKRLASATWKM